MTVLNLNIEFVTILTYMRATEILLPTRSISLVYKSYLGKYPISHVSWLDIRMRMRMSILMRISSCQHQAQLSLRLTDITPLVSSTRNSWQPLRTVSTPIFFFYYSFWIRFGFCYPACLFSTHNWILLSVDLAALNVRRK